MRRRNPGLCDWREDDEGVYQTTCGHAFVFDDGGPTDNGARFCCYCGLALVDVPYKPKRFRTSVRAAGDAGAGGGGT